MRLHPLRSRLSLLLSLVRRGSGLGLLPLVPSASRTHAVVFAVTRRLSTRVAGALKLLA